MENNLTTLPKDTRLAEVYFSVIRKIKEKIFVFFNIFKSTSSTDAAYFANGISERQERNRKSLRQYIRHPFFLPGLVVFVIIIFVLVSMGRTTKTSITPLLGEKDNRVDIKSAKATQTLNKSFTFPIKDEKGKVAGSFIYTIDKAELRDEIVVEGKKATSVKGRTFLVLNLKLVSNLNNQLSINARDYVRLTVNDGQDKLAADIHNDPVVIQPISTKITRLAFPINDTDNKLTLQIGELIGTKQLFKLAL